MNTTITCEIRRIDKAVCRRYCAPFYNPEAFEGSSYSPYNLEETITEILRGATDMNATTDEIVAFIRYNSNKAEEILNNWVHIGRCMEDVLIRRDFSSALKRYKDARTIARILHYAFSKDDISALAKLHKGNRYRKKIEELLEDANFHTECGDFASGNYDMYL